MQPEVDLEEHDLTVSPWIIAAAGFLAAWLGLGLYVLHHPHIQTALTRHPYSDVVRQTDFYLHMFYWSFPVMPVIFALIACVFVWTAFLHAEWSDTMLFSAAVLLTSTILLGGMDQLFYLVSHVRYGSSMVTAGVTAYVLCLLIAHRAKNAIGAILSLCGILYALVFPYYAMLNSLLDIAGGVFFAAAIFCFGFFIAERAGVNPFAAGY